MYRRRVQFELTPTMIDILVTLAGSAGPMPAVDIAMHIPGAKSGRLGKPLAGLKMRGHIQENGYIWRHPHGQMRTWTIRWEGVPNYLWGRVMVDHARRHDYNVKDVMSEDDLRRCEVAA